MSNILKTITPGTLIGDTNRYVLLSTLVRESGEGTYDVYIVLAHDPDAYHKYVVWYVSDRPEGYHAESGEYFHDAKDAIINWQQKGGK
jgi:hypothetical protein